MSPTTTKVAGTKRPAAEADGSDNDDDAVTNSSPDTAGKKKTAKGTRAAAKKRKTSGKVSEDVDFAPTGAGKKTTKARKAGAKAKTDTKADDEAEGGGAESQMSADEGKVDHAETNEGGADEDHAPDVEA